MREYRYLFEKVIPFPLDIYSLIIWMFVLSQNSFVEALTPQLTVLKIELMAGS